MQFLSEALRPGCQARLSSRSEKYARQIGHLPQVGVKIKQKNVKPASGLAIIFIFITTLQSCPGCFWFE